MTTQPVQPEPEPTPAAADLLQALRRAEKRRQRLEVECDRLIDAAIDAGASFAQVGAALDITRQAVRQRHLRQRGA